jgi:pyroglutamyl-peptidase
VGKSRVLVTGFKPFLGENINPSEILLEHIKRDFGVSGACDTLLLPVSFRQAFQDLETHLEKHHYDHIFLLGQAGGRAEVCFERVGLNWIETENPDEESYTPKQGLIADNEESALFSKLPLTEWCEELKAKSLPAKVSLSAGGYVCNYLYFKTLQKFAKNNHTWVVFIHVPYLPEQAANKPTGTPALDLETMKKTLYAVLGKYL